MSFGVLEILLVLLVVLVIFGPKQLPKLFKIFGDAKKSLSEGSEAAAKEAGTGAEVAEIKADEEKR